MSITSSTAAPGVAVEPSAGVRGAARAVMWRWVLVALSASLGEGAGGMRAAAAAGARMRVAVVAGLECAAVLAPPLLVVAFVVATVLPRPATKAIRARKTLAIWPHSGDPPTLTSNIASC